MEEKSIVLRRSWVEVSLSQLVQNYQIYRRETPIRCEIMAVVKADAYGHGDSQIALALQTIGVKQFAVANIEEGCGLRKAGVQGNILILGYTPVEYADCLIEYDLTQSIISEEYCEALINTGRHLKCQYAIDTGMNRIGLDAENSGVCEQAIRRAYEKLNLTGVFSHLCVADTSNPNADEFTRQQIQLFQSVVDRIKDLKLPFLHLLNSAGGLRFDVNLCNLVRLGIILYGLKPDYSYELPNGIEPILIWKSVVSMVKTVHPGESIGYGRTYMARKEMRVATIPTGYADGYNRGLSNKGYVLINGKKAPIVGRICMDQFMVDVSAIPSTQSGDEVILLGHDGLNRITADDMALQLGTIGYEVVCNIGKRVPRVYL